MFKSLIIAQNVLRESLRKKDFYVFLIFLLILVVFLANINMFNVSGISRYLKEMSLEMAYLFSLIIVIVFSAKLMPQELGAKTIYPLLAKPVSRRDVLAGKFLGACFIAGVCFSIFYSLIGIAAALKGEGFSLDLFFQGYILWSLQLMLMAAMVIFFSMHLTVSANITLSFCIYFLMNWFGPHIREISFMLNKTSGIVLSLFYYLLPHFEFYDLRTRMVHMWTPLPAFIMGYIMLYTLIYVLLLISAAIYSFKKKIL
ncbi:MAG: ABC transporter permease subunit [Candidatus Omnitrophota bacterium]